MNQRDAGALFDKIADLYRGQISLPEDRTWGYPLLAAVTLTTYHAGKASDLFILDIEGSTASGKDEAAKVFRRAGHRVRPIAIVPTVPQLYRYTHMKAGKEPRAVIFNEQSLRSSNRDALAILNAGVSREHVVPRNIGGKQKNFRPFGIKWLVHEGTLPRSFHSLRRRCIRLQTAHNKDFTPMLVTDEELDGAVEALRPELKCWYAVDLKPLIAQWLHNRGTIDNGQAFKLHGEECKTWSLVLAVAEYSGRLDALIPALGANRTGQEVNLTRWWRERALPMLKELDPAGFPAQDLLDVMREHFGLDMPSLSADSLGRYLQFAIADRKLPWMSKVVHGRRRYWRRRKLRTQRRRSRAAMKRREAA